MLLDIYFIIYINIYFIIYICLEKIYFSSIIYYKSQLLLIPQLYIFMFIIYKYGVKYYFWKENICFIIILIC